MIVGVEPASSQSTQFSTGITEEQEIHAIEILSPYHHQAVTILVMMLNLSGLNHLPLHHFLMKNQVVVMQKMLHQNHHCHKRFHFSIFIPL